MCSAPAMASEPWTLAAVMRAAVSDTPDARIDDAAAQAAAAEVDGARAALLPDLSVAGGVTLGTGNVVAGGMFPAPGLGVFSGPPAPIDGRPGWQGQAGLGLRWDLLGLVARLREVDAALARSGSVDAVESVASLDRAWGAAAAWLAVAEADAAWQAATADQQVRARLATTAAALSATGVRPAMERAQALVGVSTSEATVARAQGALDAATVRLATALRRSDLPDALGPLPSPPPSTTADAPRLTAADADVRAQSTRVAATAARSLPRLELLAAASVRAGSWPPGAAPAVAPNWGLGVVVDVPLLDAAARRADTSAARAALAGATEAREITRALVAGQRAEAAALHRAAQATVTATRAAGDAAQEALRLTEARYAQGLLAWDAVADAALAARDADLAARLADVDVVRAALLVDYAAGDLSAWMEAP